MPLALGRKKKENQPFIALSLTHLSLCPLLSPSPSLSLSLHLLISSSQAPPTPRRNLQSKPRPIQTSQPPILSPRNIQNPEFEIQKKHRFSTKISLSSLLSSFFFFSSPLLSLPIPSLSPLPSPTQKCKTQPIQNQKHVQ